MKPVPDLADLPEGVRAVLEALRFNGRDAGRLCGTRQEKWPELLNWCDRRQVTLLLHALYANQMPEAVERRIAESRARYAVRFARLERDSAEIAEALDRRGIEFVLLKGMSHAPELTPDPLLRGQGDIDLWFADEDVESARRTLADLGYKPRSRRGKDGRHLAPMARPSTWKWRGDLFDPEMPIHVEAHYRLWSDEAEYVSIPDQSDFWHRREIRYFGSRPLAVLCPHDLLGFAAMHFLLHLLHGDLPLERGWEVARFLHNKTSDDAFWSAWLELHSPALRKLEALSFAIVRYWFSCNVNPRVAQLIGDLPAEMRLWLEHYALSPLKQQSAPNKDELWLHLALVPHLAGRLRIVLQRLFPLNLGRKGGMSWSRLAHHGRAFTSTVRGGFEWLRLNRQMNCAVDASRKP